MACKYKYNNNWYSKEELQSILYKERGIDKYGKLVKPEISIPQRKILSHTASTLDGKYVAYLKGGEEQTFNTKNELDNFIKSLKEIGIQPTQTNETLKESIDSVKDKINQRTETSLEDQQEGNFEYNTTSNFFFIGKDKYEIITDAEVGVPSEFWDSFYKNGKKITEKEYEEAKKLNKPKEYTSQALINKRIAALKDISKKYPRSLIRSEVVIDYGSPFEEFDGPDSEDLPFQKIPSNISPKEKALLNQFHKKYFDYVATLPQEFDNPETVSENIPDALEKIKMLQKVFPDAIVIMDENMDELGVVLGKDHGMKEHEGKIVIKVNPSKFSKDTIIHEFAHILIDTYDQQVIKNTIDKLRGTDLWEEVASLYPELDDESLGKEVLATAIGMEGADLFDRLKDPSLFERIKSIIDKILLRASRLLGINPYTARRLAKELLYDMVSSNLTDYETVQDQYSKQGVTYDKLKDRLDRFRVSIKLNDDTHEYTVTKKDGTVVPSHEITSGTTYVKEILPELDFTDDDIDAVVIKRIIGLDAFKARFTYDGKKSVFKKDDFYEELKKFKVEHPDFDNVKSKLVDDWNAKAKLGTEAHAYLNNLIEEKPTSTDNLTPEMVKTLDDIYKSLKAALREGSIMYSELPIYYADNKGKKIAGTIDLLILHKDGTVDIIDYKTFGSDNMANDIAYANYVKYKGIAHTAQLALYKTLLEQYGYKVDKLKTIIIKRGYDENGNINSLTRLPKLFNAFTLHTTFYKNNQLYTYNKIQTIINNSLKIRQEEELAIFKNTINSILFNLAKKRSLLEDKIRKSKKNVVKVQLSELDKSIQETIIEINSNDYNEGILTFLQFVLNRIPNLQDDLAKFSKSPEHISDLKNEIDSYNSILLDIIPMEIEGLDQSMITTITNNMSTIQKDVDKFIIDYAAELIASKTAIGENSFRNKYTKEFEAMHPVTRNNAIYLIAPFINGAISKLQWPFKLAFRLAKVEFDLSNILPDSNLSYTYNGKQVKQDEYNIVLQDYINKKFEENAIEIDSHKIKSAIDYLKNTPGVRGMHNKILAWGHDARGIQDYMIRSIVNITDENQIEIEKKFADKKLKLEALLKNKIKFTNQGTYEKYIDENAYLQGKYKSDFIIKLNELSYKKRAKFIAENATIKYYDEYSPGVIVPNKEWLNPDYKGLENDDLYNFYTDLYNEIDNLSGDARSLQSKSIVINSRPYTFDAPFIKIPAIPKTINDSILDSQGRSLRNIRKAVGESLLSRHTNLSIEKDVNDVSWKNYLLENDADKFDYVNSQLASSVSATNDIKYVPTKHFRGRFGQTQKEHAELVSKNLSETLMADYMDALQYNMTEETSGIADILNQTFFIKSIDNRKLFSASTNSNGNIQAVEKSKDMRYKQFQNVVIQKVFRVPPGNDAPLWLQSSVKTASNYISALITSANLVLHGQNFIMGNIDTRLEALGNRAFNGQNLKNASKYINLDSFNTNADLFGNNKTSLVNLIKDEFHLETYETNFSDRSLHKKIFLSLFKNLPQTVSGFVSDSVDTKLLFSIIDSYKAMNEDGKFIDQTGKVVAEKDAVSVLSFYEKFIDVKKDGKVQTIPLKDHNGETIVKNAYLKLNPMVKKTNKTNVKYLQTDIIKSFKAIKRELIGNSEQFNKSLIGQSLAGIFLEKFRGWLVPGIDRRFKGFKNLSLDIRDEINESQIFYDDGLKSSEEGYYTTLMRYAIYNKFIFNLITAKLLSSKNKNYKSSPLKYRDLSTSEINNLSKVAYETGVIAASIVIARIMAMALKGDKDKDLFSIFYALFAERTIMERVSLSPTPWSVGALTDVLSSPVPGLNVYESISSLFTTYKKDIPSKGIKEGDYKIQHKFPDYIPIYKMYNRDYEAYYNYIRE